MSDVWRASAVSKRVSRPIANGTAVASSTTPSACCTRSAPARRSGSRTRRPPSAIAQQHAAVPDHVGRRAIATVRPVAAEAATTAASTGPAHGA